MPIHANPCHAMPSPAVRAVPCHAKQCHAVPSPAVPAVPCHALPSHAVPPLAGDTLTSPRPASRLGTGSQPCRSIRAALAALVEAWHRWTGLRLLWLQAEERSMHKSLLCTLWGSLGNTTACRYRFAGLRVKGFTVFIINTINRFVVLL